MVTIVKSQAPCSSCRRLLAVNAKSRPEPTCRACRRAAREQHQAERAARSRSPWRIVDGLLTCQRGHVLASDADMMFTQGRRRCRQCRNDREAATV